MYDFILCSVPKSDPDTPLMGPCIMKAVLNKNGYSSKVLDFNIELYEKYKEIFEVSDWEELDYLFRKPMNNIKYDNLINEWVDRIISYNPKFVGFTIFSSHNIGSFYRFSKILKEKAPNIKLVIGGPSSDHVLTRTNVDYCVVGYGEEAILKILKNEPFEGINDHKPCRLIDLSSSPFPDFSDLDLSKYRNKDTLYTYSTRGCTQQCKFCHVNQIWNGFNMREPQRVLEEMNNGYIKYGIRHFSFCDSLINGNLPHMRNVFNGIKGHNFKWYGMLRIRKMFEYDYDLLKQSGCETLKIGIESGSQNIRKDMGKYFSNQDVYDVINQLDRVSLDCELFFITGYPTETDEDFNQSKEMVKELSKFRSVKKLRVQPIEVLATPLEDMKNMDGYKKRYNRYHELRELIFKSGFSIVRDKKMKMHVKTYTT